MAMQDGEGSEGSKGSDGVDSMSVDRELSDSG